MTTRSKRTWFGTEATVTIGPGFCHRTGVGGVVIPHPPVANWLLRKGLAAHQKSTLVFAHEFAHFQTAPLLVVYLLAFVGLLYRNDRIEMSGVFLLLISGQAAWEMMSEGLLLLRRTAEYRRAYEGVTGWPRLLFWAAAGMLSTVGWMLVLYS